MTPQEEQLLNALVERVNQTQLQEKYPDAEDLLNRSLQPNPDALYILAQTVLVQNIALDQARAQVAQLQQQLQQAQQARQPAHATSFLGSLLGHRDPDPPPSQDTGSGPWRPQYPPVQQYAPAPPPPPLYAQPQYQQPQFIPMPSGQPSFLRGAAQTAAGVAAGALAFEGVESILHGFGHPAYGWGSPGLMGGGYERPMEETVINNYYDDPNAHGGTEHHGLEQSGGLDQQNFGQGNEPHFHASGDQSNAQLQDASYVTSGNNNDLDANDRDDSLNDNSTNDDLSNDDTAANDDGSGFDDSGSFDDGSGFDSGGGDFS